MNYNFDLVSRLDRILNKLEDIQLEICGIRKSKKGQKTCSLSKDTDLGEDENDLGDFETKSNVGAVLFTWFSLEKGNIPPFLELVAGR